jgi:hypothetical protein
LIVLLELFLDKISGQSNLNDGDGIAARKLKILEAIKTEFCPAENEERKPNNTSAWNDVD